MTISKDRVKPSPLPDSWKLREIFATGIILGSYLAMMTVIFFWAAYETNFFPVRMFLFLIDSLIIGYRNLHLGFPSSVIQLLHIEKSISYLIISVIYYGIQKPLLLHAITNMKVYEPQVIFLFSTRLHLISILSAFHHFCK